MSTKHSLLKVFSVIALLAMIFSNIQPSVAQAQSGGGGERQKVDVRGGGGVNRKVNSKSGKLSFIGPEKGQVLAAAEALQTSIRPQDPALALAKRFAPEFGIQNPEQDLVATKNQRAQNGRITARYQQKYQGIPVMGGELIVNTNDNGDLYSMNGEVSADLSLSTQPAIDAATAKETALQATAKSYQKNAEDFIATEPALWIYDESLLKESTRPAELVWRTDVTPKDAGMPVRELVLVNAQSGEVSLHFNQIDTEWKADTAPTSTPEPPQPTEPPVSTDVPDSTATPAPLQAEQSSAEITTGQSANLAATLYVATTGNDLSDCKTTSTPCATIQAAINKASNNDVVKVAAGTYTGTDSFVITIGIPLSLSGGWNSNFTTQTGASIIDGQNVRPGVLTYGGSILSISLERFAIINGYVGSGGEGGGIFNSGNTLNLNNVTLSNNVAYYGYGGGIYNGGILNLNNVTLSNNSAGWGGGIYNYSHTLTFKNTLIGGNTAIGNRSVSGPDCFGTINTSYYSLIGDAADCQVASGQGNLLNINPRLGTFDSSGGYYPLMLGSRAIDAGNPTTPGSGGNACLATDQRGVARPIGTRCDIGAYEGSVPWTPMAYVNTYTADNYFLLPGIFICNQTDPNCASGDSDAKSAHTYAIGTYNLYLNKFSRDSIDNAGMIIKSTVHYCNEDPYNPGSPACPYDNAFWDGEQMVYGAAHGYALADDVIAHELTHGVTQYESNLFYYFQSGAINESLSDVFGEYYDQTNGLGNDTIDAKWQIGEDVSGLGALRSMSDPTIYGDPDMMISPNYFIGGDDNGGVHYNSGVNNKAVYLMVDGDTFNTKTVTGIGWDKVAAIYYEVNANLLTSGADYSDLYYAVQQACTNLTGGQKGITSADCVQVKNALDAVEMNYRQKNIANFEDPGFEYSLYSDYYWAQDSTNFYSPLCSMAYCGGMNGTAAPRTGAVWGWFGGTAANETAWLSQPVYFPRGYSSIKLNFYLWIGRADKGSDANDRFMAQVDGVTVFTANATQKSSYSSYKLVSVDVNRFAKNSLHTVRFISVTSGQRVDFNLDDVSLTDTSSRIIRGNVGTAGAVLSYSNNGMKAVTSDANGNYTIAVPYNWSGTVTPWRACYTFTPGNLVYDKLVADRGGQNYSVVFNGPNCGVSAGIYNDIDPNWTYIGKWASFSGSGPYNNDLHYTGKPGDWAWFIFNGTQFILNYTQATNRGSFEVYVDGDKIATVDANGTTQWQKTFTSPVYPAGMHVAQFKNIGGKGPVFDVDAIDIRNTTAPGAGMYDDGYFNWRYTGKWASYSGSGPYNNTLHYSGTTGNIAAFMFTGTQFILNYSQATNRGSFEVYVDGNKITTVNANGTTQWQKVYVSPVYSSGTHEVQLKNIGGSGSVLDVDALQIFNGAIPGIGKYDDHDVNWSYSGSWPTFSGAGPYNDTLRYTGKVGNTASFPFSGTQFTLSYTQNTNRGSFEVYVDGSKIATVNANGTLQWRKTFTSPILAAGVHVAQIKNIGGTNPVIDVDAIEVLDTPIPAAGKYDDSGNWFYSGKWVSFSGSGPYSSTLHYTATVGNTASFTFTGTQFTLSYTQNTSRGSFEVYVDGGKIATVNANGALQWQKTFTSPILTDSTHVVQLKNIGGSGSITDVDAIEILDTPVPAAGKYDDINANWFYYGTWSTFSGSGPYNNSLRYTTGVGNWAWFPFDGTQFILTYTQNTNRGSFEVYVDGSRIATIVATGILQWQKTYTSPTFTAGTHVVQFKNIGGSGSMTDVDAIQVLP